MNGLKADHISICLLKGADIKRLKAWLYKEYIRKWYVGPCEWLAEINDRITMNQLGFANIMNAAKPAKDTLGIMNLRGPLALITASGKKTISGRGWQTAL